MNAEKNSLKYSHQPEQTTFGYHIPSGVYILFARLLSSCLCELFSFSPNSSFKSFVLSPLLCLEPFGDSVLGFYPVQKLVPQSVQSFANLAL